MVPLGQEGRGEKCSVGAHLRSNMMRFSNRWPDGLRRSGSVLTVLVGVQWGTLNGIRDVSIFVFPCMTRVGLRRGCFEAASRIASTSIKVSICQSCTNSLPQKGAHTCIYFFKTSSLFYENRTYVNIFSQQFSKFQTSQKFSLKSLAY